MFKILPVVVCTILILLDTVCKMQIKLEKLSVNFFLHFTAPGSGYTDVIEFASNSVQDTGTDPDPQPCFSEAIPR
jgi:hypothetical protein